MWDFLKKWWWLILIIVIIVIAVFFPYLLGIIWGWLQAIWAWIVPIVQAMSWWQLLLVGLGIAYLIDPEGTLDFISDTVGWVGDFVGDIAGAALGGLLSSPIGWVIIGGGLWLLFGRKGSDGKTIVQRTRDSKTERDEAARDREDARSDSLPAVRT